MKNRDIPVISSYMLGGGGGGGGRGANKDLTSVANKASWSGYSWTMLKQYVPLSTATDIQKVEAVQKAASWMYRDYNYSSSTTAMLKNSGSMMYRQPSCNAVLDHI